MYVAIYIKLRKSHVFYASNDIALSCCNPLLSGIKGIMYLVISVCCFFLKNKTKFSHFTSHCI